MASSARGYDICLSFGILCKALHKESLVYRDNAIRDGLVYARVFHHSCYLFLLVFDDTAVILRSFKKLRTSSPVYDISWSSPCNTVVHLSNLIFIPSKVTEAKPIRCLGIWVMSASTGLAWAGTYPKPLFMSVSSPLSWSISDCAALPKSRSYLIILSFLAISSSCFWLHPAAASKS